MTTLNSTWRVFALGLLTLMLAACGGGGGGSAATSTPPPGGGSDQGELIIGITDAPGDYLTYSVDVESLTLTRANGDVVEALPVNTRIDFAELTEVTELLNIATVPAGNYESVRLRMNFATAEILVQDDAGNTVAVAPVDTDGAALGVVDVQLMLSGSDIIRIAPGRPAAFSLDFDLDASNTVDLAALTVTVEPMLLATAELETGREHRVRGVIDAVRVAAEAIDLQVRPFRHRQGQFGAFTVHVDAETSYEVDGEGFTGTPGLEAVAALPDNAPLVALGAVSDTVFTAHTIVAGSSVPWSDADVVAGVVTARVGDTLTIRGGHVEFADGARAFRGTFTVTMDADTAVSAPGEGQVSTQSVSVGQRVTAWGEFADDVTLIASRVRMHVTQLSAEVVQASPLAVDLVLLSGRRPALYDFAGTGVTPAEDADVEFYEIDTTGLALATVEAGDLVRVRGRVNDFGAAPADFIGRTVIDLDLDSRAAHLAVGWEAGTAVPFISMASTRVDVDLLDARKSLDVRGIPRPFFETLEQVALIAPASGEGVYSIKVRGSGELHVFRNFADLVDALMAELEAGNLLYRINAGGVYDVQQAELTAHRAGFVFSSTVDS